MNSADGGQYDGLTLDEAKAIVMTLSHEARLQWFGYKMGWKEWRQISQCSELVTLSSLSRTKILYKAPSFKNGGFEPPRQNEESKENIKSGGVRELTLTGSMPFVPRVKTPKQPESESVELSQITQSHSDFLKDNTLSDVSSENRRKYKRFTLRLHAEIICQEKIYETFTTDVSLGGVALEGTLPDWVAGYGTVILSTLDMKHRLEFMCSVVENQNGKNFRLELYPSTDSRDLKRWLEFGPPSAGLKRAR